MVKRLPKLELHQYNCNAEVQTRADLVGHRQLYSSPLNSCFCSLFHVSNIIIRFEFDIVLYFNSLLMIF